MAKLDSKKVLIVLPNWLGDAVMSLPLIQAVRVRFPYAHLSILTKPDLVELLELLPISDEVIPWDNRGPLKKFWKTSHTLRRKRFDLAIILPNSFGSGFLCFLSCIPRRFGYARDGRALLLTNPVRLGKEILNYHQIDYYLHLLEPFGINGLTFPPRLNLNENERSQAKEFLREIGCSLKGKLLGMIPGAKYGPAKRWEEERFAELGRLAVNEFTAEVLIFGSEEEAKIGEGIVNQIGENAYNLAGKTTLRQLAGLLSCCDLLLTNDTGPMHLASAVGTKVVAIFGSTDPLRTAPLGEHIIIRKRLPCSPCFQSVCNQNLECMRAITIEDVWENVKEGLS